MTTRTKTLTITLSLLAIVFVVLVVFSALNFKAGDFPSKEKGEVVSEEESNVLSEDEQASEEYQKLEKLAQQSRLETERARASCTHGVFMLGECLVGLNSDMYRVRNALGEWGPHEETSPASIRFCDTGCYIYDEDQVWFGENGEYSSYGFTELDGVVIGDLEPVASQVLSEGEWNMILVKGGERVFYKGAELAGVDMNALKPIEGFYGYFEDGKNVYSRLGLLEDLDLNQMEIVGTFFLADNDTVYSNLSESKIENLEGETLEILNKYYVKDKDTVGYIGYSCHGSWYTEVAEADAQTFELIADDEWTYVAKDKNAVYVYGEKKDGKSEDIKMNPQGQVYNAQTYKLYSDGYRREGGC